MTAAELKASSQSDASPPSGITGEARSLWHLKKGSWDEAHRIAQDIHTPMGSWIHALIHVIEGDQGNANYWFSMAGRPAHRLADADALWDEIAHEVCGG